MLMFRLSDVANITIIKPVSKQITSASVMPPDKVSLAVSLFPFLTKRVGNTLRLDVGTTFRTRVFARILAIWRVICIPSH